MRLTLRTMLAYLDDALSPQDAAVLGEKIKQSDYATRLSRHIRSSIRETRVGAPALSGKGTIDANAVAEYLDSTLPADQIEGYETLCLPPSEEIEGVANAHMAETAACHQILTLVLGEDAECSLGLRDRIYRLGAPHSGTASVQESSRASAAAPPVDTDEQHAVSQHLPRANALGSIPAPPSSAADESPESPAAPKASRREIPDYLRGTQPVRILPLAIMLMLGFFLTFAALRALGPFGPQHPLLGHLLTAEPADAQVASVDPSGNVPPTTEATEIAHTAAAAPQSDESGSQAGAISSLPQDTSTSPQLPATPGGPAVTIPEPAQDTSTSEPAAAAGTGEVGLPPLASEPPATAPQSTATSDTTSVPDAENGPSAGPTDTDTPEPPTEEPVSAPSNDSKPEVGRFISGDQILARQQPETDAWHRVKQLTTLKSEDHLKVLPGFRPQVILTSGLQITFVGASDVTLRASGDDATPSLDAGYTRLLASTNGMAGQRLNITTANSQGTLTFVDADTVIALEAKRFLSPGSDPLADAGDHVTQIVVTGGQLTWLAAAEGAQPVEIKAGQVWASVGKGPAKVFPLAEPPAWTVPGSDLASTDRYAAPELESLVGPDRPLSLTLMEQVNHRQRDVRSLVARCLSYLDVHEPMVTQLNDNDQRRYWFASFDVLRETITRSPESAGRLQEAFEKKRGDVAADLFRLSWGYSQQQLEEGAAAELVAFLESEEMDIRVLTYATLKQITGRTELYNPERDPQQEKSEIQSWKRNLEKGAIQYQEPPMALPYPAPGNP